MREEGREEGGGKRRNGSEEVGMEEQRWRLSSCRLFTVLLKPSTTMLERFAFNVKVWGVDVVLDITHPHFTDHFFEISVWWCSTRRRSATVFRHKRHFFADSELQFDIAHAQIPIQQHFQLAA